MEQKVIMIVDDEMDVLTVLEKRFTAEGYSVITADNGNDALILAKESIPDLIILDIGLGDMHGGEVAMKLNADPYTCDIPLVFISALYSSRDQVRKSNIYGGKVLFSKPYDIDQVLTSINEILKPAPAPCR